MHADLDNSTNKIIASTLVLSLGSTISSYAAWLQKNRRQVVSSLGENSSTQIILPLHN
jgi:hypothetical protein